MPLLPQWANQSHNSWCPSNPSLPAILVLLVLLYKDPVTRHLPRTGFVCIWWAEYRSPIRLLFGEASENSNSGFSLWETGLNYGNTTQEVIMTDNGQWQQLAVTVKFTPFVFTHFGLESPLLLLHFSPQTCTVVMTLGFSIHCSLQLLEMFLLSCFFE